MTEPTDHNVNVQTPETGRLLTPEEASFLQQFLLDSEKVVVVGRDDAKKDVCKEPNAFGV